MKRILASLVLVAYTAAAISFSFSVHYCGGSLQGVYLAAGNDTGCCDDESEADGCCEDKVVRAKTHDDHTVQVSELVLKTAFAALLPQVTWSVVKNKVPAGFGRVFRALHGPAPPLIRGIPLFILHRNFRI